MRRDERGFSRTYAPSRERRVHHRRLFPPLNARDYEPLKPRKVIPLSRKLRSLHCSVPPARTIVPKKLSRHFFFSPSIIHEREFLTLCKYRCRLPVISFFCLFSSLFFKKNRLEQIINMKALITSNQEK